MASHTKEQELLIRKILSYNGHEYYKILDIERTATEGDIKKSYRRLAIKLHPDKNNHPRAAEAFKYTAKAYEVLSDPSKKRIYDQTGQDPDSRGGGGAGGADFAQHFRQQRGGGGGRGPFGNPQGMGMDEDIFNLFFGGGQGGAQTFTFGNGGGFRFGGAGGSPFGFQQQQPQQRRAPPQAPQRPQDLAETLKQLLPLLLFILVPLLSNLFSGAGASPSYPSYSFTPNPQFPVETATPHYKVPFYVAKNTAEEYSNDAKQRQAFGKKVETAFIQTNRNQCHRERMMRNDMIDQAHSGWFFVDEEKLAKANAMSLPSCARLERLGLL